MNLALRCRRYQIDRSNQLTEVDVQFFLPIPPSHVEEIAEALKRIELYLAGDVNLVKSDGAPRCFYCGTKQADNTQTCSQCGAPL